MIHKRIFVILTLLILFSACKQKSESFSSQGQGMITYDIRYPDSNRFAAKQILFPKKMILVFKGNKAAFIVTAGMGMVQLVNLMDGSNRKYTSLLIDNLRENIGCKLTPEEIEANENAEHFEFETVNGTRQISGIECRKAIGKNGKNGNKTEVYYDPAIEFNYFNSPFKSIGHLMLEYTHTINNLTLQLSAVNVDLKTPVDSGLFEIKGKYRWVNQKEFFDYLNTF